MVSLKETVAFFADESTCQESSRGKTEHLSNSKSSAQVISVESAVLSHDVGWLVVDYSQLGLVVVVVEVRMSQKVVSRDVVQER